MARITYNVYQSAVDLAVTELNNTTTYASVYISCNGRSSGNLALSGQRVYTSQYWYLSGLSPGTTYYASFNITSSGGSTASGGTYFTTQAAPQPPSAPSYISVYVDTYSPGGVTLSWPASSGASYYTATIRNAYGSYITDTTVYGTSTYFNLSAGTSYYAYVIAYNGNGSSSAAQVYFTTASPPTPSPPSSVSATASTTSYGQIAVYFTAGTNATYYTITIRDAYGNYITSSTVYNAYTNYNFSLSAGTYYQVGVTSYNSYGSSSTNWTYVTTASPPLPSAVSYVSVTASTTVYGRLTVYFPSASNATSYYVTIRLNNTSGTIITQGYYSSATNINFDLTQGSTYVVGVTSYNAYGSSGTTWSSAVRTNTPPLPSAVSSVSVSASTSVYGRLTVYFPSAANATSYYVTIRLNSTTGTVAAQGYYNPVTNINFDLTQGSTYIVGVTSYNAQGQASATTWSAYVTTIKEPLPSNITGLTVTTSTSAPPSVTATWNASSNVNTYRVELYTSAGVWTGYSAGVSSTATRSYTFSTGLSEYATYFVKVYGQNNSGNGNPTNSSDIRTGDFTDPSVSITGITGLGNIALSWSASDSGSGLASTNRFQTYIGTRNGGQASLTTSGFTMSNSASWTSDANNTSLIADSVYWVGVRAYDNAGRSTVVSQSVTFKLTRPSNWEWVTTKTSGANFSLTAAEWNGFTARINQFRLYKGLSQYSFTTVVSGNTIFASQINEAVIAIRAMATELPSQVSGGAATASFINSLRTTLNSIT